MFSQENTKLQEDTNSPGRRLTFPMENKTSSVYTDLLEAGLEDTERLTIRLANARNVCKEYASSATKYRGAEVWVYKPKQLAYCVMPKVGTTFWKRIFRFLSQDYQIKLNISRPSDIDRRTVHEFQTKNISVQSLSSQSVRKLISEEKMNSFMFSRDPYSRLWSGYLDKVYLPQFQRVIGTAIEKMVKTNATALDKSCGNNVTFAEFIEYIIRILSSGKNLDGHFNPVFKECSPCHVCFDVLGKMETFQADSEFIFNNFGLKHLSKLVSFSLDPKEEVHMLIEYIFDLESNCTTRAYITERLWKSFQINGYISKDIPLPSSCIPRLSNCTSAKAKAIFEEEVVRAINESAFDKQMLRLQKRSFLVEAYKQLPVELLWEIPIQFQQDFEIFGYDKQPKDIYQ